MFCVAQGFDSDEVYDWTVQEFSQVYKSLQRNRARDILLDFSKIQQAFGGDKKSIKAFVRSVSVWLPPQEREDGAKGTQDFVELVRKGLKIGKKP